MPAAAPRLPPRALLVMPEQWPRALLRATLRERGYDAVGTRGLPGALRLAPSPRDRGDVAVVVLDQQAVRGGSERQMAELVRRFPGAKLVLLARASVRPPASRPWARVLRRPLSIERIAAAVEELCPVEPRYRTPLD